MGGNVPCSVDLAVTAVATKLMAVNASTSVEVSRLVLADLVRYFGVDVGSLRYNDHKIRASKLIAEWPQRPDIPDPDPLCRRLFRRRRAWKETDGVSPRTGHRGLPAAN
jgi:hypothetical protein